VSDPAGPPLLSRSAACAGRGKTALWLNYGAGRGSRTPTGVAAQRVLSSGRYLTQLPQTDKLPFSPLPPFMPIGAGTRWAALKERRRSPCASSPPSRTRPVARTILAPLGLPCALQPAGPAPPAPVLASPRRADRRPRTFLAGAPLRAPRSHHARSLTAHPQREQDCRSPQGDDGCRCALGSLMGLSFPGGRARGSTRPAARIAFMMARYSREGLIEEGGTR